MTAIFANLLTDWQSPGSPARGLQSQEKAIAGEMALFRSGGNLSLCDSEILVVPPKITEKIDFAILVPEYSILLTQRQNMLQPEKRAIPLYRGYVSKWSQISHFPIIIRRQNVRPMDFPLFFVDVFRM